MFENITSQLGSVAEKLLERLSCIERELTHIRNNTQGEIKYETYLFRSGRTDSANKEAEVRLSANEGFSWFVERVSLSTSLEPEEAGNCAIYLNSIAPDNLIDIFKEPSIVSEETNYFVPRGSVLIFHFYELSKDTTCVVTIQSEELQPRPVHEGATGMSNEGIDRPRSEPVPSGEPYSVPPAPPGMFEQNVRKPK